MTPVRKTLPELKAKVLAAGPGIDRSDPRSTMFETGWRTGIENAFAAIMTPTRMLEDDPQWLIDERIEFEFEGVPGRVRLVNGWAAGGAWHEFEFIPSADGGPAPFAGRKIWCAEGSWDHSEFTYLANAEDDGFRFNSEVSDEATVEIGGYYPEWDRKTFKIKEDNG